MVSEGIEHKQVTVFIYHKKILSDDQHHFIQDICQDNNEQVRTKCMEFHIL